MRVFVAIEISAKTAKKKIVSSKIMTFIDRIMFGRIMKIEIWNEFAPSILADSIICLSMDLRLVRISNVANGIHVQESIVIIEASGYSFKKSIPS